MPLRIHGRRRLKVPSGLATRPTSARVRQSVFGILHDRIQGCRWLDLCSGAGAMGAEALGRGAALVVGVERSPRACSIIHQNWENVAQAGQSFRVLKGDIITVLRRMPADIQYDVVYLDPPYQSDIYDAALPLLPRLLDANGIVMVEHRRGRLLPETVGTLHLAGRRSYGQTEISIYNHKSEQNLPVSPQ